ncbi:isoaspartyl peptidase/L-asparaginase family protein [Salinimicrobium sp. TH3]|uniref:isoaspartyl peptidase/L-asparaginase family protein n=1 Tax=Salinimicrobium sp. TH3 TaxID=2997342 RepID=UPI002272F2A9|nr:isoaspartyl peptidase/L-asparaginase [Salinimicrobium sp. TH3]MCY2685517.1 isoaspartyl peptidase/L-asparaginase [Salinimicrobium sp. TH3]
MTKKTKYSLCIHGGAGVIDESTISAGEKELILQDLEKSLKAGEKILQEGGSAVDAVCAAVEHLENSEHFNAGRGAVYSRNGKHLLEASLMEGRELKAGALANSSKIKNPVKFAKSLMNRDDIVMISGKESDLLAEEMGHEIVENDYFHTSFRKEQWQQAQKYAADETFLDHSNFKKGTVGAVAMDSDGNLAAATSTGGMTNKMEGRIGDSAIIGCGTYANNNSCAVSCTGIGEFFIRATVASYVSNLMEFAGLSLEEASKKAIFDHHGKMGGDGGLVAVDGEGNISMTYNSAGMYRGFSTDTTRKLFIWDKEEKI